MFFIKLAKVQYKHDDNSYIVTTYIDTDIPDLFFPDDFGGFSGSPIIGQDGKVWGLFTQTIFEGILCYSLLNPEACLIQRKFIISLYLSPINQFLKENL